MPCKGCTSDNQQYFSVDLALAFPGVERLKLSPVYVCPKILVCLDCGYAELVVAAAELERLKKGMAAFRSTGA